MREITPGGVLKTPMAVPKLVLPKSARVVRLRNRHFVIADFASLILAALIAFAVRFEDVFWVVGHARIVTIFLALSAPTCLLIFHAACL